MSDRLSTLAHQVPKECRLADIGTDHGLIPVYLVKGCITSKVIATDISEISLRKAEELLREEGLSSVIETRLGSGLEPITPGEVDTLLIAGMGGIQINKILEEGFRVLKSITTLILQPMRGREALRRWLIENNYTIYNEVLVKDGKYLYEIIVASHGRQEVIDDIQFEIGFRLLENKDPLFGEFIERKIIRANLIIDELKEKGISNSEESLKVLTARLEKYEEAWKSCVP